MSLAAASAAFLDGYRLALQDGEVGRAPALVRSLLTLGLERAPFAHEGAAMGWTLLEERTGDTADRIGALVAATREPWHPFVKLGVGCAFAKLGRRLPEDSVTRDGYGFQLGLVDKGWSRRDRITCPRAERGRGRALWFVTGGSVEACLALIGRGPHADERWRGVATACTFAGDPRREAAILARAACGREAVVAAGAREALRLWRALGGPPDRAVDAAAALDRG